MRSATVSQGVDSKMPTDRFGRVIMDDIDYIEYLEDVLLASMEGFVDSSTIRSEIERYNVGIIREHVARQKESRGKK